MSDAIVNTDSAAPQSEATLSPMCAAALDYAARGWWVFPAPPGKKKSYKSKEFSNTNWGMTINPKIIRRDFNNPKFPNANVGIATGIESGIFVIEADTKEGHDVDGLASIKQLETKHGVLPETLIAISPSGSVHRYYKHPGSGIYIKSSASEIAPGVDIRGDGGMVIAPPSVKPGFGKYVWLNDAAVADAPTWLIELILATAVEKKSLHRDAATIRTHATTPRSARCGDPVERDKVQAALDVTSSHCGYDQWYETGAALHYEFGDAGFDLFDTWSARSPKYDADECAAKWEAVADVHGFTAATIFHYADKANAEWRDQYRETQQQQQYDELRAIFARAKGGVA